LSSQLAQALSIIQGVALTHDSTKAFLGRKYPLDVKNISPDAFTLDAYPNHVGIAGSAHSFASLGVAVAWFEAAYSIR
jgi:hypothetical protein